MASAQRQPANDVTRHRHIIRDSIHGITNSSLERLMHRAGVFRISALTYEEIRGIMRNQLENILRQVELALSYTRNRTVSNEHVKFAIKALSSEAIIGVYYDKSELGDKVSTRRKEGGAGEGGKQHRFRPGTQSLRDIKRIQKADKPILSVHPFNRLVREIMHDFNTDVRFKANAIGLLRIYIENHLTNLLREAFLCTIHAKRETLMTQDIQLARFIHNKDA